ncbi:MAG: NTP transferase domain-containing protein, partial [Myxococcales bacterium]|nr:NTP transferase domain-containing protein [Myxococcales bacterium]
GHELVFAKTDRYAGKILCIRAGGSLSRQYHIRKQETIYVSKGTMIFEIKEGGGAPREIEMTEGMTFVINPGVIHRMTAVTDCEVFEVSTPELDDVVRLSDSYGRVQREVYAVVMAGGSGTRFWPLSRRSRPKQLLDLDKQGTLIRQTVDRVASIVPFDKIIVVTAADHEKEIREELPRLPAGNIIAEPCGRNTAACIGLAAVHINKISTQAVMLVLPSDHKILDEERFAETIGVGIKVADEMGSMVTIGIHPQRPETGYGYIKAEGVRKKVDLYPVRDVAKFVEKPDIERAKRYVKDGNYFWNCGIFIWKVERYLEALKTYLPDHYVGLTEIGGAIGTAAAASTLARIYPTLTDVSVDYGIMEHGDNVVVIPSEFGWSDLGSWSSLSDVRTPDEDGNIAEGEVVALDVRDSVLLSPKKLLGVVGMTDVIVVDTEDAILVCPKSRAQDVKKLVEAIKARGFDRNL